MSQSRRRFIPDALTYVAVNFAVVLAGQMALLPLFGLTVSLADNLRIAAAFSVLSIMCGYAASRLFNRWRPDGGD